MTVEPAHESSTPDGADKPDGAEVSDATGPDSTTSGAASSDTGSSDTALVDWESAGRRLLVSAKWLLVAAGVAWVVVSLVTGQWRGGMLGNFVGLALVGMFLVEVWVVGGSALRGMLRAGEGGHRLSSMDVGLLPPQLRPGGSVIPPLADALGGRGGHDGVDPDVEATDVGEPDDDGSAEDDGRIR